MSIVIYTYHDPYRLNKEAFWEELQGCPYYCVSQTLINGLRRCYYNAFPRDRVKTVKRLTDTLFPDWLSTEAIVRQHADIDNIINDDLNNGDLDENQKNVLTAFRFNREDVFQSIRTLFELRTELSEIRMDEIDHEQEYLLKIFKRINFSDMKKDFCIKDGFSEDEINEVLIRSLETNEQPPDISKLHFDSLVIHGVHQFSPVILRAIEELAKYKKVILLFNYQNQYKEIYQTWIDIYSGFDRGIEIRNESEFFPKDPSSVSYSGNMLADTMGKLSCGKAKDIAVQEPIEVMEFDNMMEFSNYIAEIFETAKQADFQHPLNAMKEQVYAADSSANEILKIYFPEQFGERQFLNYPLGHFFVAIAEMWDADANKVCINDLTNIRECLGANIIKEETKGELLSVFGRMEALFSGCTTIEEMCSRLKSVKRSFRRMDDTKKEYVSHISYYSVSKEEIDTLVSGLEELEEIALLFYEDFESQANNFKIFYEKLRKYLREEILDSSELDEEFEDIVKRVLSRLEEVKDINTTASFECLKSTMSIYLTQEPKFGKGANWIIRNFEQIDGDILRSSGKNSDVIYHFACLSDEEIGAVNQREFAWPLNDTFFEIAQNPVDWKDQVFVRSKKEYKNFKRYALLYGLEFNRGRFKLSYVKNSGDREKELYYILKILNAKIVPYKIDRANKDGKPKLSAEEYQNGKVSFGEYDLYRYRMCRYRFLLESVTEGNTVYKDEFLLAKYLEVVMENQLREEMQGNPVSEQILTERLYEIFDSLKRFFPFIQNIRKMDAVNTIRNRVLNGKVMRFPILGDQERKYMMIRELFIHKQLEDHKNHNKNILQGIFSDASQEQIQKEILVEQMKTRTLTPSTGIWCKYCANKNLCTAYIEKEVF